MLSLGTAWFCICKYFKAQRADSLYWLQNKSSYKGWVFWTPLRNPHGIKHFYSHGSTSSVHWFISHSQRVFFPSWNQLMASQLQVMLQHMECAPGKHLLPFPPSAGSGMAEGLTSSCPRWSLRILRGPEWAIFPVFLGSAHSTILIFHKHRFVLYQFDFGCNRGRFYGLTSYWKWENCYI